MASNQGTVFYKITKDNLCKYNTYINENSWAWLIVWDNDLKDSLLIDSLYGSAIIDDTLYFCVTDNETFMIGDEEVEPEFFIEDFDINIVEQYTTDDVPQYVYDMITDSDINTKSINIEKGAIALLQDGEDFQTIVNDAKDLGIIE